MSRQQAPFRGLAGYAGTPDHAPVRALLETLVAEGFFRSQQGLLAGQNVGTMPMLPRDKLRGSTCRRDTTP